MLLLATTAQGAGVGLVTTAKTLPPATIAVIDPETGTSSGGGTTDVNVAVGDIILFRFRHFPVPQQQLVGINGWITEYVPPNLQVVGVRLIDENDVTIPPRRPGLAEDGYATSPANSWSSSGCTGAVCPTVAGGMSQLYGDTGVFYSTDPRTARNPSNDLIRLSNGIQINDPAVIRNDSNLQAALGVSLPFFAHNTWDSIQANVFGSSSGESPHLYGSPVAGPDTHYGYEATAASSPAFQSQRGPWNRVQYPGSRIATGDAPVSRTGNGMGRTILDASSTGWDLTPNHPLPHVSDGDPASANALRIAVGEVRAGLPVLVEVAFRVLGTPLDPGYGGDVNCGESFGGDMSGSIGGADAENNPWGLFVPSPACVFLNLLFDITADELVRDNGDGGTGADTNDIEYTIRTRNLSTNTRDNVWVRQRFASNRVALSDDLPTFPDQVPTCQISNCDGDGFDCLYWNLGTLQPSDEVSLRTRFEVSNGGDPTTPMFADFTSDDLGTRAGDPCAGGSISDPGFETRETVQIRTLAVLDASMQSDTPSASAGGTASLSGTASVVGTQLLTVRDVWLNLPAGWTATDTGGTANEDFTMSATRFSCSGSCGTSAPEFNGVNLTISPGASRPYTFGVNVPNGTAAGIYPIDIRLFTSQSGYGGTKEYYYDDLAWVSVGAVRSDPPVIDCPALSSWTTVPGDTTEADGTVVRVYFNGIERGSDPSTSGGRFDAGGWFGAAGTFGSLYGGLEIRATAQAPGENVSALSSPCVVVQVSQCQDGIDNDGDGLIDFPADPGCSGPTDGNESDPQCSDGVDNDGDGDVDWPADLECASPDDETEGGSPACSDGIDNDGDGAMDFPADTDCTGPTDRTEVTLRRCMNGLDDDGDGAMDYPDDPGCHSQNDDDEQDFEYPADDIRARLLLVVDTSGSMNWHTCADEFTDGDGSQACAGSDVSCATCAADGCGNGIADDSRLFQARSGLRDVIAGFGEVEYGLMRFHQRPRAFACPTNNASDGSGGWQGAGAAPCGGGFSGGDVLVGFSPENEYDMLEWMDNEANYPGSVEAPAGLDFELRGSGTTPIAGSLIDARGYLDGVRAGDTASSCRPYRVILVTDGQETCGGLPVTAASDLQGAGYLTSVIGFATDDPGVRADLDAIASAGGTTEAIFADDANTLSAAISDIVNDSILVEACNGVDDDCDMLVDEGFALFCDVPGGQMNPVLCVDPGETVCDGVDDNCDGEIDEGLRNACGTCGPAPTEVCNGVDDDCDGPIDEGGVCDVCTPQPEICDGLDQDCDTRIDEGLMRACGTDVGECTTGIELCDAGDWGTCSGIVPTQETCNGLDDDCDGVVDQITRPCGLDTGACTPGTELCSGGDWSGVCVGGQGPQTEICNSVDDDCDTRLDEDIASPGACGSDIGQCESGTLQCVGGSFMCVGGVGPQAESCNALDDDCDGPIDEGISTGAACGTCGDGVLTCVMGDFECRGDRVPSAEQCNGIDDDCDGPVDEGGPFGGDSCGSDVGKCVPGVTACVGGALVCQNATEPDVETCNESDDDCDGLVDEGNPGGGASCGATDVGECDFGVQTCVAGALVCVGETTGTAERCDNLDNDCDTRIDEGDLGGGTCGEDTGECLSGTLACAGGELICQGAVGPTEEVCNNLDDDCDGFVDDGLDVGAPCGTDVGECVPGIQVCMDGAVVCDGAVGPSEESCNILDDDCDGSVDEALPLGGVCGMAEGACVPGMLQCVTGREVCVGEVPSGPETCDCEDNDCDGSVDEEAGGSLCPGDSVCLDCSCALPCSNSEFGRCPPGRVISETDEGCFCVAPRCNPESCAEETLAVDDEVQCAPDTEGVPECVCVGAARCTSPCEGVVCGEPLVCEPFTGECVEDNCRGLGCPTGQRCDVEMLLCVEDPCETASCQPDDVCRSGACETSCAEVSCPTGEVCASGACVVDPCAGVSCAAMEVCDPSDGSCVADMCDGVSCASGSECDPLTGECRADACGVVRCPEEQHCEAGECVLDVVPETDAGLPQDGGLVVEEDAGEGPMDAGFADPEDRVIAAGGCLCRASAPARPTASWLILPLFALLIARRRRS